MGPRKRGFAALEQLFLLQKILPAVDGTVSNDCDVVVCTCGINRNTEFWRKLWNRQEEFELKVYTSLYEIEQFYPE